MNFNPNNFDLKNYEKYFCRISFKISNDLIVLQRIYF